MSIIDVDALVARVAAKTTKTQPCTLATPANRLPDAPQGSINQQQGSHLATLATAQALKEEQVDTPQGSHLATLARVEPAAHPVQGFKEIPDFLQ